MRAEKFAIAIQKNKYGKFTVQVLGIVGDRVTCSDAELEEQGLGFATVNGVVDRLWKTIRLRLNRGQFELTTEEENDNSKVGRI